MNTAQTYRPTFIEDKLLNRAEHLEEGGLLSQSDSGCLREAAETLERFRELLNLWLSLTIGLEENEPTAEAELIDDTIWAVHPDELPDEVERVYQ